MNLVIDASVACKWYFPEILTSEAIELAKIRNAFLVPDLILIECANVAWAKVKAEKLTRSQARQFVNEIPDWFDLLVPTKELVQLALEMAFILRHPLYDCIYLALAENESEILVTADSNFVKKVEKSQWKKRIVHLGDI